MIDDLESGLTSDEASKLPRYASIDHIALVVADLPAAIRFFRDQLGFRLMREHEVRGRTTGMKSAEMEYNGVRFVLCIGTEPSSQVSRLYQVHGPGVAHIALSTPDVHATVGDLKAAGVSFDTNIIAGQNLTQAFTSRCPNTGLSFELIKREENREGFEDQNIQELFEQLEAQDRY